jgi:hypothetical protein
MLASQWMKFIHLHVIWGCGIGIMAIFQLYYNQCSIGTCHVIKEGCGIFLNYIIIQLYYNQWSIDKCHMGICGPPSNWIIWCVPCVWSQNLEIINLLKMSTDDIVPHGHLCYTYVMHDTWHFIVCGSSNICEVEPK